MAFGKRFDRAFRRLFWLAWWAALAWALLALLADAHAGGSSAIARNGEDWVRITDKPCRLQSVLGKAEEGTRGYYRMAYARVDGVEHDACLILLRSEDVFLAYADGDSGLVSGDLFHAEPDGGI